MLDFRVTNSRGERVSNIPDDLKYAESHEWARLEADGLVRIGITDHAQAELGDLVYVEMPDVGRVVKAGEELAVVESVKTASNLYSPVAGTVVMVNDAVNDAPEVVNDDAYEAWLFCVKADDTSDLDTLLDAAGYRRQIEE